MSDDSERDAPRERNGKLEPPDPAGWDYEKWTSGPDAPPLRDWNITAFRAGYTAAVQAERERLEPFLDHREQCGIRVGGGCDCGLEAALRGEGQAMTIFVESLIAALVGVLIALLAGCAVQVWLDIRDRLGDKP